MNIYPEITGSKLFPILVVGDDWPTDPANKQLFADALTRENISKYNLTFQDVQSSHFKMSDLDATSFLIVNLPKDQLESWSQAIDFSLLSTTVVVRVTYPEFDVQHWINTKSVTYFIHEDGPQTFERLFDLSKTKISRRMVIKQITEQSKSVDQVIQDQEEKIIGKTLDIELSNQEQNQKLKRERQLLKFLKDLALSDFYESFLRSLKNEFKVFHELGEMFLFEVKSPEYISILSIKVSDRWRDHKIPQTSPEDFSNSKMSSTFFANLFKRPFGKVISIPLKGNVFLILESHLNDSQNIPFQEFLNDRQDVIKMVFDKIDNEEKMNSFSFRWEKIFDFIKDPIAVVDENLNVVAYNNAFEKTSGLEKSFQVSSELQQNVIAAGSSYDMMAFEMPKDGGYRKFVHTFKDQTENKKLQLELIQKKKMATIGKLAGHLSHELNNPLTGIRSMAQILLNETEPESQMHKDLVEIESAAQRSLSVIKNFIEFSDDKNTQIESTDLHGLIERTIPLMKTSLRNHVVIKSFIAKKFIGEVNQPLFQQVLFNLIKNSIQSMDEKGRVLIQTENPTSSTIQISISDSGKGIPKSVQAHIFQPFFTTKEKVHGNGLGLSIVKTIVESFKGRIDFTSEEGKGTQFNIELPLVSKDENISY